MVVQVRHFFHLPPAPGQALRRRRRTTRYVVSTYYTAGPAGPSLVSAGPTCYPPATERAVSGYRGGARSGGAGGYEARRIRDERQLGRHVDERRQEGVEEPECGEPDADAVDQKRAGEVLTDDAA